MAVDESASGEMTRSVSGPSGQGVTAEWIVADGAGGFASSTPPMCPTRRYHGLLVAVPPGRAKRCVFLARFDETVRVGGDELRLACARYGDELAPRGDRALESFTASPFPKARYRFGAVVVEREIVVVHGSPVVLCRYTVRGAAAQLELRPLLACRDADALTVANDAARVRPAVEADGVVFRPYPALPPVTVSVDRPCGWFDDPTWYRGITYADDLARGYDGREDQLSPGRFVLDLEDGGSAIVAATIREPVADPARTWQAAVASRAGSGADPIARIGAGAREFLYRTEHGRLGICAGYPWFGEWGRDTFIALPGLTLARDRLDLCEEVLTGVLPFVRGGLVPNIFGTGVDDSHYGSVDAALWFARAVDLWAAAGGDRALLRERFLPALREIATCYRDGTELGVAADDAMLIAAGGPELNATWMDARTPDGPVTPRDGCAVEINALWYALLDQLEALEEEVGDRQASRSWRDARRRVKRAFVERLWLADRGHLADRWHAGAPDPKVRPNMVLAAALARSPLTKAQRRAVVDVATAELLTPRGLRTLAPSDPEYVGRYRGGPEERDHAYHQGTVWPWLLGFYVEACLRARGSRDRARLQALLDGFEPELDRAGLEHVSEVFDGDPPHEPGGTIAQAWSSAELLRAARLLAATG